MGGESFNPGKNQKSSRGYKVLFMDGNFLNFLKTSSEFLTPHKVHQQAIILKILSKILDILEVPLTN